MTGPQKRLALWQAFVTFYSTVVAGAGLAELIGLRLFGVLALCGAGLNAATVAYLAAVKLPETLPGQRDAAA